MAVLRHHASLIKPLTRADFGFKSVNLSLPLSGQGQAAQAPGTFKSDQGAELRYLQGRASFHINKHILYISFTSYILNPFKKHYTIKYKYKGQEARKVICQNRYIKIALPSI